MASLEMTSASIGRAAPLADQSVESSKSAVSWAAIFAGGLAAFAFAMILIALGAGLGLSAASPYGNAGVSLTTFTISAAIWLIVVQWISAALGGFLTGRLRTKWVDLHTDEVMFRDTAHGLLAWAFAVALGIFALALGANIASASARIAPDQSRMSYYTDGLFRSDNPSSPDLAGAKAEAGRILSASASNGKMLDPDKAYLDQLVSKRTGLAESDAAKRVDSVLAKAQFDADAARRIAAKSALYVFFSMIIGAFIASVAGAIGGRQRDLF